MVSEELQKKIDRSIKLLKSVNGGGNEPIEVAYSGGKDSDVILQLAKEAGINYRAIYKNTTIDPPGTIKHVKEMGVEMVRPKETFFHLIEKNGLPNRFTRFCCKYLKEYKILDKSIIGVRRSESWKRAKRYTEPTECKFYGSKKEHVEAVYPILEWTDEDVEAFIKDRKIKCAPVYYDEQGKFHVERRLGCMCCPLASIKHRLEEFKKMPGMVKQYVKAEKKWFDTHENTKSRKIFANAYEQIVRDFFFATTSEFEDFKEDMFRKVDCKQFLENYFNVKL